MPATRYCTQCDRRLPLCVRSDRRFCSSACRVWAFRHPGQRRPNYGCGRVPLPNRPGQAQPKTLAAAKVALSDARRYAGRLESAARAQNTAERSLLRELDRLRAGLSDVQRDLATAREDHTHTEGRLRQSEEARNTRARESYERQRQIERMQRRLRRTESELRRKQIELAQVQADFANARRGQELHRAEHERQLNEAHAQLQEITRGRDELMAQIQELTAERERLRSRGELAQLHDDLTAEIDALTTQADEQRQQTEQAEEEQAQAEEETDAEPTQPPQVELLQRRLQEEQDRRIAAEERIAQLLNDSEANSRPRAAAPSPSPPALPGQYQRHAIAIGYDCTRDPLLALMRDEVVASDRYADWQARHRPRRAARRRDPAQTLDEQAYAAAIAARWRLIDHPHVCLLNRPTWRLLGCLLDERSEAYLLTLTQERMDEMRGRVGDNGSHSVP
ncbi:MAG: hypothetical protein JNM83_17335 [Myxococcales bacterium]|nr:hypothetical protein [Myxococcales bacterium]